MWARSTGTAKEAKQSSQSPKCGTHENNLSKIEDVYLNNWKEERDLIVLKSFSQGLG